MTLTPIASNQTEVASPDGKIVLYSYSTPVAVFVPGRGAICTTEKYSVTTSKHVTQTVGRWGASRIDVTPEEFEKNI